MSLREQINTGLADYNISELVIDREHVQNGIPATSISFVIRIGGTKYNHNSTFAKANGMSGEDMVKVIKSYLNRSAVLGKENLAGEAID